jgi:hypothetical protein
MGPNKGGCSEIFHGTLKQVDTRGRLVVGTKLCPISCPPSIENHRELLIIDPHLSGEVIEMLSTLDAGVEIRILGTYFHGDFKVAYKKLQKERGKIEVRQSDHFDDRFMIVDRTAVYQLGGSIKDAGAKATVVDKKENSTAEKIVKEAEGIWPSSPTL